MKMADIKSTHSGGVIKIEHAEGRWAAIPVKLIEDTGISPVAKLIAIWLTSRPAGWQIAIGPMLAKLRVGQTAWRRASSELKFAGYLRTERRPGVGGQFVWHITFCADPGRLTIDDDQNQLDTIRAFSTHGKSMHGARTHKSKNDLNNIDKKKKKEERENSTSPVATLSFPPARLFVNEIGLTVEAGNARDEQAMLSIKSFGGEQIEAAIAQAASSDAAGRAFPTATLKILKKEKPGKGEEGMMFGDWLAATVASGEDAVPAADPVFQYAETAGIPDDFLKLQWGEFKQRYSTNDKRYKDWREVFRKSVRGNWFRLWALREGQDAMLTTAGVQANRVMQASERAEAA
jgi:hypothetical protein